ncbi:mandelate racemase/muconate lactonizing enzyme family protein [uncultured Oscillibacter sp.]|uniref:mandelate racemase/muconate lactonizing enzyme family protein n=1 Tax=uncultured Oscillibacter sp. TaxID=876091 RepID=UPI0028039C16|nr:mandelate racemase/muconate lactonizing enzyme family protein [uncultured Oscillibacter sp.]
MKITGLTIHCMEYQQAFWMSSASANQVYNNRFCIVVQIATDAGIVGIGESDYPGGPPSSVVAVLEKELGPALIGKDPLDIQAIWDEMYYMHIQHSRVGIHMHAISGIDIALWDIAGKAAGLPCYRLWGGHHSVIPAYASGGMYYGLPGENPDGLLGMEAELELTKRMGFRGYKMKVGKPTLTLEQDVARVRFAREHLGPETDLMVDANCTWDILRAYAYLPYLEELGVKFLEEPFQLNSPQSYRTLARQTRIPLAGSENESSLYGFRELMDAGVYFVQPNVCRVGGPTNMRRIMTLIDLEERVFAPHSWSSIICMTANMHLMATTRRHYMLEYDINPSAFREDLIQEPYPFRDGCYTIPDRPGLGLALNMDTVDRHTVSRAEVR